MKKELSRKNPYWIEKHRYLELKHFCRQYPFWREMYYRYDGLSHQAIELRQYPLPYGHSDPTADTAMAKAYYSSRMELLIRIAQETDEDIGEYILDGVTTGRSYDQLKARENIPCGRDTYYELYRKFFWLLHQARQ